MNPTANRIKEPGKVSAPMINAKARSALLSAGPVNPKNMVSARGALRMKP